MGKTHGVSSDKAPKVSASQINPQIGWSLMLPSAGFTDIELLFELLITAVFATAFTVPSKGDGDTFALVFPGVGDDVGVEVGLGLGVVVGEAPALAASIVMAVASFTVFGGRHVVSLQT